MCDDTSVSNRPHASLLTRCVASLPEGRPISLKSGKWCTIAFRIHPPGEGGLAPASSAWLNLKYHKLWTMLDSIWLKEDGLPPPNVYRVKTFLVKLQTPLIVWTHPAFLIYDEQHSFDRVFFYGEDSPEAYKAFIRGAGRKVEPRIAGPGGPAAKSRQHA